jgi:hypothetical protein
MARTCGACPYKTLKSAERQSPAGAGLDHGPVEGRGFVFEMPDDDPEG